MHQDPRAACCLCPDSETGRWYQSEVIRSSPHFSLLTPYILMKSQYFQQIPAQNYGWMVASRYRSREMQVLGGQVTRYLKGGPLRERAQDRAAPHEWEEGSEESPRASCLPMHEGVPRLRRSGRRVVEESGCCCTECGGGPANKEHKK